MFCRAIEDTIVGRKTGTDRTTKARRQRIEIDKHQRAHWKAQKRTGDALPKQLEQVIETGEALVTEAKGFGSGTLRSRSPPSFSGSFGACHEPPGTHDRDP